MSSHPHDLSAFLAITPASYAKLRRANPMLPDVKGQTPQMIAVRTCFAHFHGMMTEAKARSMTPDKVEEIRMRLANAVDMISRFSLWPELVDIHDACLKFGVALVNARAAFEREHPRPSAVTPPNHG